MNTGGFGLLRFADADETWSSGMGSPGGAGYLRFEIERGVLFVVFLGGLIVGLGCVFLGYEVSEVVGFFVGCNLGGPFFLYFVPVHALVFGCFVCGASPVLAVLCECCEAEVCVPVVQSVVVDVVDHEIGRGVFDLSVHFD